jgi:membrane-associated phospholipid phosphatase
MARSVCAAALALLMLHGAPAVAGGAQATAGEPNQGLTLKQAGRDFLHDTGRIWTSPLRIKGKHVGPIVTFAAATAFLIAADEDIRDAVQRYVGKHPWVKDVGPVLTEMGGIGGLATAGAFFGAGLIFKDERAKDTGYLAASAIAQTFLVDSFIKGFTGRQRPFVADGEDHWSGPVGFFKRFDKDDEASYSSFPSGHSAEAFALATVVALQYRDHPWVPVLAYTVGAGVGLSRMTMDRHWASDVVVGALIGHLVARLVVRNHGRQQRLVPALACSGRAVTLSVYYSLDPVDR